MALCAAEPDGGADVAGGDRAHRHAAEPATVLFMGWFGPRGLASIVLGLVYLEQETHQPGEPTIRLAVMATVLLSIFAHGLSAMPGIKLYARKVTSTEAVELDQKVGDAKVPSAR